MKLQCGFDKEYVALFSNAGSVEGNGFYLLAVSHKSGKGGFDHPISVDTCRKLLKRKNQSYFFRQIP